MHVNFRLPNQGKPVHLSILILKKSCSGRIQTLSILLTKEVLCMCYCGLNFGKTFFGVKCLYHKASNTFLATIIIILPLTCSKRAKLTKLQICEK